MDTTWRFLTNHARVLLAVAGNAELTLREIGDAVGITERRALDIVNDLALGGYLVKQRAGRRNRYEVVPERPLRRELAKGRGPTAGDMLALLADAEHALDS